jgi:hypothetical protein
MITEILVFLARFIVLMVLQVVILNNIQFGGLINPFLYIMFIMILPVHMSRLLLLVISFITGITLDMFSNTMGMHAAACVFMAYIRPGTLKLLAPRDGYEAESSPTARELGYTWFMTYAAILTFAHHFVLFYIEVFRFSEFFSTLLRVILSTVGTWLIIMISQYLFSKPAKGS